MIYVINNSNNKIITDIWFDFVIDKVHIYFDHMYIGEFYNQSISKDYLSIIIPAEILNDLNLENKEYDLKYYKDNALIKTELVSLKGNNSIEYYGYIKNDLNIVQYERE